MDENYVKFADVSNDAAEVNGMYSVVRAAGIDPYRLHEAVRAAGSFADYCVGEGTATALGLQENFWGVSEKSLKTALDTARGAWPYEYERYDYEGKA